MTHASRKEEQASAAGETAPIAGPVVGWIAGAGGDGTVLVDFEGNAGGPLPARSTVALDGDAVLSALGSRQGAVLLFERGDPALPLILGLVQPRPAQPMLELMLPSSTVEDSEDAEKVATVDGQRRSIAPIATSVVRAPRRRWSFTSIQTNFRVARVGSLPGQRFSSVLSPD